MKCFASLFLVTTALMAQSQPAPQPTEVLKGPRVDIVMPAALRPGNTYTLSLEGKNLSPETVITFGRNIAVIGVPTILSPTEAMITVIVSLAAPPGVAPASAEDQSGGNTGPGGVIIGTASTSPEIILDLPREAREPMIAGAKALFSWHESHPGTANFFLYELIDEESTVVFTAQTTKPLFQFSRADVSVLPLAKSPRKMRWRVRGMANKADAVIEVESSGERSIRLPARR